MYVIAVLNLYVYRFYTNFYFVVKYRDLQLIMLTVPITTAADDILNFFFYFSKKISHDISCESSAW